MTLIGNRVFADDQVKISSLVWVLIQYACALIKERNLDTEADMHTERRRPWEHEGKNQGNEYTRQGMPKTASTSSETRRPEWNRFFLTALRKSQPC